MNHASPNRHSSYLAEFLPAFLKGERPFALHYSEPEAGSDLASLRTTARRDGDDWVISGQKLWSTYGDRADYSILAVRTDPDAKPKRSEEHTSELQSLMRTSYAVFCLKKKTT